MAKRYTTQDTVISYTFLAPFLLVFFIFLVYPIFYSFFLSFHEITDLHNAFTGGMKFVGLKHFKHLLSDFEFYWSLLMTAWYAVLAIPSGIMVSLFLAIMLNNNLKGASIFRAAYFLPNVLDMLVVSIIWVFIYSPKFGILDILLNKIGITYFSQTGFLGNQYTAMPSVIFALVLKGAGFGMVLFLAALQNISTSVYEAADIDGASNWEKFFYITLPLVKPIILFMTITGVIGALNAFAEIYGMTSGGPTVVVAGRAVGATNLSGYYLYRQFAELKLGYAAAISYALLVITMVITIINLKFFKTEDD